VNKWDLIEKDSQTMAAFERKVYQDLKYLSYAPILFISAKTGQRVPKLLNLIDHVAEEAKKRITTSLLNKNFGEWVERFKPPLYKNRIVKLNYITQVSTSPPTFVISTNISDGVHFSYERYLINRMREAFDFEGVPIRLHFRRKGKERKDG
jgi:GTP-binding protein